MFALTLFLLIASLGDAIPPTKRAPKEPPLVQVSKGLSVAGISTSNRTIEVYNFTEISNVYGKEFAQHLLSLVGQHESQDAFTPVADWNRSENTPYGQFELGSRIASSRQSVIYEIVGKPHLVIKYQVNCIQLDSTNYVHPLLVDYIFGERAAKAGVGPRMYYISPPSKLCLSQEGKCGFKLDSRDFNNCVSRDGASLRYMIMERMRGDSLVGLKGRFRNGIVPFYTSILIGYSMIANLERLHKVGKMVHGDVHSGNIILEHLDERNLTISLKFIDYGRSFANVESVNETVRKYGWTYSPLLSEWELEGYATAPRDDIIQALQVMVRLMMPWSFIETEKFIAKTRLSEILRWKRSEYWFVEPRLIGAERSGYDPVGAMRMGEIDKSQIRQYLQFLLRKVRAMGSSVNSIPPYAELLQGLHATHALVRRSIETYSQNNSTTSL